MITKGLFKPDMQMLLGLVIGIWGIPIVLKLVNK